MTDPNLLAPGPKWLVRTTWAILALAAVLLLVEFALVQSRGRSEYAKIVLISTLGISALIALLGLVGLGATSRFRWLWLIPLGAMVAVVSVLLVVAKFNYGM